MSELLRNLSSYVHAQAERDIHVVLARNDLDEMPMILAAAEPRQAGSDLEGRNIDAVPVGEAEHGKLAYFMDGMQRPRGPIYFGSQLPMMYGYVAATIRVRGEDRRMRKHDFLRRESLYFPYDFPGAPVELASSGFDTVDTGERGKSPEEHPLIVIERAEKKVSDIRSDLESRITSKWLSDFDGRDDWLLVDGSLSGDYHRYDSPNIVGLIKSHQTQYFLWEDQQKILSLKTGERSGVFIPKGRNRPDVYSWYLRLRPNDGRDVYFGLVRVEAAKCERTLEMADEISRWLLAERSPLSMPDARWDRLIYPIHDCELYMKSVAPSHTSLDSLMISLAH
ncbi:hypothetical protein LLG46_06305 [bacterium]|nr:hypothetical protein [bacterium]